MNPFEHPDYRSLVLKQATYEKSQMEVVTMLTHLEWALNGAQVSGVQYDFENLGGCLIKGRISEPMPEKLNLTLSGQSMLAKPNVTWINETEFEVLAPRADPYTLFLPAYHVGFFQKQFGVSKNAKSLDLGILQISKRGVLDFRNASPTMKGRIELTLLRSGENQPWLKEAYLGRSRFSLPIGQYEIETLFVGPHHANPNIVVLNIEADKTA